MESFPKPPKEEKTDEGDEQSGIEQEQNRLEGNLAELGEHLEELHGSEPTRKEKVMAFVRNNYPLLIGTVVGLTGGAGDWLLRGGTMEDFVFKAGFMALLGGGAQLIKNRVEKQAVERKRRLGMDEGEE